MWNNFCAVVEDLFWFVLGRTSQSVVTAPKVEPMILPAPIMPPILLPQRPFQNRLPVTTAPILLPIETNQVTPIKQVNATAIVSDIPVKSDILQSPVVMYVSTPDGTACTHVPQIDFDAVIELLPYGTAVTVIGYQGRFASVNRSNITGWVLKEAVTPHKHSVWPTFVSGQVYASDHEATTMTRVLIHDMFSAGSLGLPLQAGEYVAVRLKSENRSIPWSRKRPRTAGTWASLLRGAAGVHIGISPKPDSIIEWQESDGEGRLGYVESVTPDLVLTMSAVGEGEAGYFATRTMSAEIWRELRPVFIEVA